MPGKQQPQDDIASLIGRYNSLLSALRFPLRSLFRDPPYTSHRYHEFVPGRRCHPTHPHSLEHSCFCKERYCHYHR